MKFEIVTSHGAAAVRYEKPYYGEIHADHFFAPHSERGLAPDELAGVYKSSYVFGEALLAIAARTADPHEVEA